jgi:hypothetical protein
MIGGMDSDFPLVPPDRIRTRARSLPRAAFAIASHTASGGGADFDLDGYCRRRWDADLRVGRIVRSAVLPTDSSATAVAAAATSDFIAGLAPISAGSRLIAAGLRLGELVGVDHVTIPWPGGTVTAAFTAALDPFAVGQDSIAGVDVVATHKIGVILTLTNQLLASSNGEAVLEFLLRRAAAQALDAELFSTTAASSSRPAGLLAGVSATSAGTTLADDLRALTDAIVANGGDNSIMFFTSPGRAAAARVLANAELPIFGSAAIAGTRVVAVCASAFFSAIAAPEIRATATAVMHFEDSAPAQIGVSSSATFPVRSMLQTDSTALLVVLRAGWGQARGTVAFIDSPGW